MERIFKNSVVLIGLLFLISCRDKNIDVIVFPESKIIDTIPFSSLPNSSIISLPVVIKENSHSFIFDTGSGNTIINSTIPSTRTSSDTVFFTDILHQSHPSFHVLLDTLKLGGLKVSQLDSYLQRDLNIGGILGEDIIGSLVWKFDFYNRKMYVTKDVANFEIKDSGIPFRTHDHFPIVNCTINGQSVDLILDTGYAGFISLDKMCADSVFDVEQPLEFWEGTSTLLTGNPYASRSYSSRVDSTYYFTADIELGSITLENEIIELRHNKFNIMGMDFLQRFGHLILDYPNQKIHFGKEQHKSLNFLIYSLLRMNSKGVNLVPSNNKAQIGRVNSEAKCLGISYEDTVLSIDGISVVDRDSLFYKNNSKFDEEINTFEYRPSPFQSLWNNFHFISDTSIIEIKRGDSSQTYKLLRQYNFTTMPDSLHDYYVDLSLPLPIINRVKTESDSYYFKFKTEELLPWGLRNHYR